MLIPVTVWVTTDDIGMTSVFETEPKQSEEKGSWFAVNKSFSWSGPDLCRKRFGIDPPPLNCCRRATLTLGYCNEVEQQAKLG